MSMLGEGRVAFIKRVKEEGFVVSEPKPDQLFIDIDDEAQYTVFLTNWEIFKRDIGAWYTQDPTYTERPSKSGLPSRHIVVQLPFEWGDSFERIAWQASLGSDPVRELLSAIRTMRGEPSPTLFADLPEKT